jgi:hypothetical protein
VAGIGASEPGSEQVTQAVLLAGCRALVLLGAVINHLRHAGAHGVTIRSGNGNGLAAGGGAAAGSLHPAADRPFSQPPGPIPRRCRAASRALRVPAGPPAAALDPGPGGAGRRPRRPPGAAPGRPAGRERAAVTACRSA